MAESKPFIWATNDFSNGMITEIAPHLLPMNSAVQTINVDAYSTGGEMKSRKGARAIHLVSAATTAKIAGMSFHPAASGDVITNHLYYKDEGATTLKRIQMSSDELDVTGSAITITMPAGVTFGNETPTEKVSFTRFNGNLIAARKDLTKPIYGNPSNDTWSKINDSTLLSGMPPLTQIELLETHLNRVIYANGANDSNGIWMSAAGTIDTFNAAADSFYASINKGDGDEIMGIASLGQSLIIAKRRSIYRLSGTSPSDFVIYKLPSITKGLISKEGAVIWGGRYIYAAVDGIYATDGVSTSELTLRIRQKYIDTLNANTNQRIRLELYRDQLWIIFYHNNNETNTIFVLDLKRGSFGEYQYPDALQDTLITPVYGRLWGGFRRTNGSVADRSYIATLDTDGQFNDNLNTASAGVSSISMIYLSPEIRAKDMMNFLVHKDTQIICELGADVTNSKFDQVDIRVTPDPNKFASETEASRITVPSQGSDILHFFLLRFNIDRLTKGHRIQIQIKATAFSAQGQIRIFEIRNLFEQISTLKEEIKPSDLEAAARYGTGVYGISEYS